MAKLTLTKALREEYERLFNTCVVPPGKQQAVERIVDTIMQTQGRYNAVSAATGIPWYFIAAVHSLEASSSFKKHLHNGDPLTARTVQVPAGRPVKGTPPFAWEDSAIDALTLEKLPAVTDWSLAGTLYRLEGYNGWGYRLHHPEVLTPYLWSYSNHYTAGKYVADGKWSATATSNQAGAAVILRRMAERRLIEFPDKPVEDDAPAMVSTYSSKKFSDPNLTQQAIQLQQWLNSFPGVFVKIDGVPGEKTSDAYKIVTGQYLPGDPRA